MEPRKKIELKDIKLREVVGAFWDGARFFKISFLGSLLVYMGGNITEIITPLFYKRFFDTVSSVSAKTGLVPVLVGIIISIATIKAIGWACYRAGARFINYFEANVMAKLRQQAFDYTIDHSYSFFSNTFAGALTQRIGRFARAFERLYDTLVYSLLPLLVYFVGSIFVIWRQQSRLAMALLVWALVITTFSVLYSRWKLQFDLASSAADTKTGAQLADALTNHNTISSFATSDFEIKKFEEVSGEQGAANLKTWNIGEYMNAIQGGLSVVIEFVVFYFAIKFWAVGTITVGTFVLIQVYILGLSQRLWGLNNIVRAIYESLGDAKEMTDILNKPHEVADAPGATPLVVSGGAIEFEDVSFSFGERRVLNDINLSIKPGEKVALIGPSGAGKSTVVKLLLRMYNLVEGTIEIDGQDIQKVAQESLRQSISLVPQDPILFHRSLMENIRYGKLNATDEEVVAAATLAHCDEFIDVLPEKYETFVGERGIKLSGGERQRVAIARAILKNAPILILDEATSSLDSHSEHLIQDALDKLMKGKTAIVIAHRLSTIRKMDRIIVVEKGHVTEEGTHNDLVSREKSLYKSLWNLQAGGFLAEEPVEGEEDKVAE